MSTSLTPAFEGVTVSGLPKGYIYRVTRYADVILSDVFPQHWDDLTRTLDGFTIDLAEIEASGGGRTPIAKRFDDALKARGWDKQNMTIATTINTQPVAKVRSHEIDMFKLGPGDKFPGVAVEMEWNNKDPFFDRDLGNFYALHRAGAVAVGAIITRSAKLQDWMHTSASLSEAVRKKYGTSQTWWGKLMPRVDVGGAGECPLFLVGLEPERVRLPKK